VALCAFTLASSAPGAGGCDPSPDEAVGAGDEAPGRAYQDGARDLPVEGAGTVIRLLADDTDGSRRQRFIVRLASDQTLLVAHDFDVAPRVEGHRSGDAVGFRGVYEWSEEGGTVRWTHHDPNGPHAAGWIRHEGRTCEQHGVAPALARVPWKRRRAPRCRRTFEAVES